MVNELHKVLVPSRGLFAAGKADRYKRDIPYWTLAQALQSLIRPLLGKSEAELAAWRDALQHAVGANARFIVDLVPEAKLIIGEPPPVPELSPQDAQRRFQLVLRRFIAAFARPEHPLALFLDDLQWLDAATLDLIEKLLTQPDVRHLILIGAYRHNEVGVSHPLVRKLETLRHAGALVQDIVLAPLGREDLTQLIADALRCEPERAIELAHLVHAKTDGNPFFALQFLSALTEEGLLVFRHADGRWSWDVDRIQAKGYTENVVDLMVGRLSRLPVRTQNALQQLACLGNVAATRVLSVLLRISQADVQADLWEAAVSGLIELTDGSCTFVHDRVREVAYSLIPEELRPAAHLRIGRQLLAQVSPEQRQEAIFEIVNHLNRGASFICGQEEREQLAELNLIAGQAPRRRRPTSRRSTISSPARPSCRTMHGSDGTNLPSLWNYTGPNANSRPLRSRTRSSACRRWPCACGCPRARRRRAPAGRRVHDAEASREGRHGRSRLPASARDSNVGAPD